MEFTLSIACHSGPFQPDPANEVARLLAETAQRLAAGETDGRLVDANGKIVGRFRLGVAPRRQN